MIQRYDSFGSPIVKITRNGQEIMDEEYAHLEQVSYSVDANQGFQKTTQLSFNISSALAESDPSLNQWNENWDIMYLYLFADRDTFYDVYMGRSGRLARMMSGGTSTMSIEFSSEGQVSFNVTIDNMISGDPAVNADELNPATFDGSTNSAYHAIADTLQGGGYKVVADPQTEQYLRGITWANGKSKPAHQSTKGFATEVAQEFGVVLDEDRKVVTLKTLDYVVPPGLYFKWRPGPNDDAVGTIISFTPDLDPNDFGLAGSIGQDPITNKTILGTNSPDQKQNTLNTKADPLTNTQTAGTGSEGLISNSNLPPSLLPNQVTTPSSFAPYLTPPTLPKGFP